MGELDAAAKVLLRTEPGALIALALPGARVRSVRAEETELELEAALPVRDPQEELHEELALREGLQKAVLTVLTTRFDLVPDELAERVRRVKNVAAIEELLKRAVTVGTPDELFPT